MHKRLWSHLSHGAMSTLLIHQGVASLRVQVRWGLQAGRPISELRQPDAEAQSAERGGGSWKLGWL